MNILFATYNSYINHLGGAEISSFLYYKKLKKKNKVFYVTAYPFNKSLFIPPLYKLPLIFTIVTFFFLFYYSLKYKIDKIIVGDRILILPSILISFILNQQIEIIIRDFWFCCTKSTRYHNGNVCNGSLFDELKYNSIYRWPFEIYKYYIFKLMFLLIKMSNIKVISISKYIQNILKNYEVHSIVRYNLVDYYAVKKAHLLENKKNIILLYAGRLSREKGVRLLVSSFKNIKNDRIRLWIVGDGPEREKLELISKDDKRIIFFGRVKPNEVYNYFKTADIIIYPVLWDEPFGRVISEAKVMDRYIIASDKGGIKEQLENYKKAVLIKPNKKDLISSINYFIKLIKK